MSSGGQQLGGLIIPSRSIVLNARFLLFGLRFFRRFRRHLENCIINRDVHFNLVEDDLVNRLAPDLDLDRKGDHDSIDLLVIAHELIGLDLRPGSFASGSP